MEPWRSRPSSTGPGFLNRGNGCRARPPTAARRRISPSPTCPPLRRPEAPGGGLPLHLLHPKAGPAAALASGRRRRAVRPRSPRAPRLEVLPPARRRRTRRSAGLAARRRCGHRRRGGFPGGAGNRVEFARDHPGRYRGAAGAVRLLRAARVGHGLPAGQVQRSGTTTCSCGSAPSGTDQVVEEQPDPLLALRRLPLLHAGCRSAEQPASPAARTSGTMEQPGCLHANMDLYKWAYKLAPAAAQRAGHGLLRAVLADPGLDMQASPYDLAALGLPADPDRDRRTARPSTWKPSGPLPPNRRCCGAGCWRRWTCWTAGVLGNASMGAAVVFGQHLGGGAAVSFAKHL